MPWMGGERSLTARSGNPLCRRRFDTKHLAQQDVDLRLPPRPGRTQRRQHVRVKAHADLFLGDAGLRTPRPRRTNVLPSNTSAWASIFAVGSGASSGSVHSAEPAGFFVGMCVPHGNDAARPAARNSDQHHAPSRKVPRRDEAIFAIVAARVWNGDSQAGEHRSRVSEVQAAMPQGVGSLGGIEADVHGISVSQKFCLGQYS